MSATKRLRVVLEADGGSRGNPGPAGFGAVVREANTGEVLAERSGALGTATNNVAEYSGLIAGLQAAADLGAVDVEVRMDSKLVVEQMSGRWQIKHAGLRSLAARAAALVRRFDSVSYGWIPRERNKDADALANKAMDEAAAGGRRGNGSGSRGSGSRGAGAPQPAEEPAEEPAPVGTRGSWEPPSTAAPTRLLLVRHGETAFTQQRRYSGRGDVPLSPAGAAQARAAGVRLAALTAETGVAAVVSSPLSRCTHTAEHIAQALRGVPVEVEPDLIECDFGEWEGRTFAEVRERWPQQLEAWLGSPAVAPPRGESFRAVTSRVRRAVARSRERYAGSPVVLVSHVSPIKLLLRDALGAGDALLHRLYLDPAGVSVVDLWPDGGVAVRSVNDTAHLAP